MAHLFSPAVSIPPVCNLSDSGGTRDRFAEQVLHLEEVMVEPCHRGETAWTTNRRGIYCSDVQQPCTFTLS